MGFSSQRDTFVPVTTAGEPMGRAIAAADRRAGGRSPELGPDFQVLTGVVPDAGTRRGEGRVDAAHTSGSD